MVVKWMIAIFVETNLCGFAYEWSICLSEQEPFRIRYIRMLYSLELKIFKIILYSIYFLATRVRHNLLLFCDKNLFKKCIDEILADATDDVDENVESQLTQFIVHFNLIYPPKLSVIIPTSPHNRINEMLKNNSFRMKTRYNSLQNVQHYSEIVL